MWCGRKQQVAERIKRRANGMGTVYKMGGARAKPWRAMIFDNGRRVTVGSFSTQTEAYKALSVYEPRGSAVRPDMTLEQVYNAWLETKEEGLSSSSVTGYSAAWKKLSHLHGLCIADIRTNDYQRVIDKMKVDQSRSSCSKVKILVTQLCKWAIQNDILDRNYGEFLILPQEKKTANKQYFTDDEVALLWANADDPAVKIVLVMIYTGMRINELFMLKPTDVYLDVPVAPGRVVSYVVGGEKTDAGRDRTIVIHSRILPIVREWMSLGKRYLVVNSQGGMIDDRNWRVREYYPMLDRLGIERLTPHKARHTFATRGAKAGISQTVMQNLLGHTKYETTANYYTHVDLLQLADGVELIDK